MSWTGRGGQRGGSRGGGRPGGGDPDTVERHWRGYLQGGYFDAQGNLNVEYVSRERIEPLAKAMCPEWGGLTSHQVRRYFGHCRALETRLKAGGADWGKIWPEVKKLDVAAADGAAKQPPKIPALFHDFIRRNVAAITCRKDFTNGFLPHFEALVGFGQAHFRRERS